MRMEDGVGMMVYGLFEGGWGFGPGVKRLDLDKVLEGYEKIVVAPLVASGATIGNSHFLFQNFQKLLPTA